MITDCANCVFFQKINGSSTGYCINNVAPGADLQRVKADAICPKYAMQNLDQRKEKIKLGILLDPSDGGFYLYDKDTGKILGGQMEIDIDQDLEQYQAGIAYVRARFLIRTKDKDKPK